MPDSARSSDPAVQRQLDRLTALSPGADVLGLERITTLLARIGNPHEHLPPVLHVAGTNGKGSTCAFLRAAMEAANFKVHAYTSPHLVRFNERIRIAGKLIEDAALAPLLEEVLDHADGIGASFFEVTTAAAFLAFARTPANATIVEVGLGGRLDATNVIPWPAITGIAQLGIDHQAFLGDTLEQIAAEKAGIAKRHTILVTMRYSPNIANRIAEVAAEVDALLVREGESWRYAVVGDKLRYSDARGIIETPLPTLAGPHQPANLALAIAMLRFNRRFRIANPELEAAATLAKWPARMQRLGPGPLTTVLPEGAELWLDGGHNAAAAEAVSAAARQAANGRPLHLVLGMLANKDARSVIEHFPDAASLTAVPVPGHEHHDPQALADIAHHAGIPYTATALEVREALTGIPRDPPPVVLVLGSLYLAGEVLAENGEIPD